MAPALQSAAWASNGIAFCRFRLPCRSRSGQLWWSPRTPGPPTWVTASSRSCYSGPSRADRRVRPRTSTSSWWPMGSRVDWRIAGAHSSSPGACAHSARPAASPVEPGHQIDGRGPVSQPPLPGHRGGRSPDPRPGPLLRRGACRNAGTHARAGEPARLSRRWYLVLGPEAGLPLWRGRRDMTSSRMGRLYVDEARGRVALVQLAIEKGLSGRPRCARLRSVSSSS